MTKYNCYYCGRQITDGMVDIVEDRKEMFCFHAVKSNGAIDCIEMYMDIPHTDNLPCHLEIERVHFSELEIQCIIRGITPHSSD